MTANNNGILRKLPNIQNIIFKCKSLDLNEKENEKFAVGKIGKLLVAKFK